VCQQLRDEEVKNISVKCHQISPAIIRYARFESSDFEDSFRTILPADANPLDPALVALALNLDPNRRRFFQRRPVRGQQGGRREGFNLEGMAAQYRGISGRNVIMIDPDLPIVELFWRSLMPWARVEGVHHNNG